jgi:hypothetical protein
MSGKTDVDDRIRERRLFVDRPFANAGRTPPPEAISAAKWDSVRASKPRDEHIGLRNDLPYGPDHGGLGYRQPATEDNGIFDKSARRPP